MLVNPPVRVYKSHPQARIEPARHGDAGIDLYTVESVTLPPHGTGEALVVQVAHTYPLPLWIVKVRTGIHIEIPEGYYGQVLPRSSIGSGKASEYGETPYPFGGLNLFASVIDSSYRGEVIVAMGNLTSRSQTFPAGTKIAQMVILPYVHVSQFEVVSSLDELSSTERGDGGFGSTGN